ncbi:DMT family transporter [Hyphomonas sp. WL0036]|uniref:DMT family transporter n=1 Tax=Hyphomonas sediminis TaxID=2866160 RepID=UPI001C7FFDD9|nr:DMT family transporter [Hyphomonas sediminis]MBY9065545.1 DMT family transporter [Hyphomonas sediminis]
MAIRDFALLCAVCLVWGLNLVVTRWVVADMAIPPIFFAALRFLGVAVCLIPFLRPRPENLRILFIVSMMIGSVHFALLFIGLRHADASAAAVTGQLGVPFSTLMSMLFLGEVIHWRRALGITLAFLGVLIIALDPSNFSVSYGLLYIIASAFIGSAGGIVMKRMPKLSGLRFQAWVGLFSFAPLFALSFAVEQGQLDAYIHGGWMVWAASAFAIIGVSVFGHSAFYTLLKKYDVSLLSPLTLMTPIWGVIFGIALLNEPLTLRLIIGAAVSLSGVLVIALRANQKMPEAALGKKVASGDS